EHRRAPGRVLPYYQHGNDSGWDNATTFDGGGVVESPDLAAYLVLQLDALVDLGTELGRSVVRWREERDRLLAALLDELWTPEGFTALRVGTGQRTSASSLLMLMPLVLGTRLPDHVRSVMARNLEAHLTAFGAATEPPSSAAYDPDGYWRGPIWAPSTALLDFGLRESGHHALADQVGARFRSLCERSGFAENFDAVTGAGLRDRAYTWTAAVYLSLCASSRSA
ncbi:MAG TPA: trehalase family glycosidase, partial [Candidatus Nanopelagicales bacterium]|nr:trehalase family glycosidase [Candidatus Nanopelagicales bacterium]